jgi:hypothetical protein
MRYGRVPYFGSCAAPLAAASKVTATVGICPRKKKNETFIVRRSRCYGPMGLNLGRRANVAQKCCVALIVCLGGAVRMRHGLVVNPL